ncbi:DNA primase [Gluconacetobacter diazotrophicus PA1 5]|uniref:DNA primase n=1 Tax=Gluconacetobacter diazotrophicus (strain ATCC 49037 / DSM 5601 / CCUG 37298 / CIP 103539 / LMG 7603 / PAl5) TaxID=272568 RepID=A9H1N8_GLUDA|nr:DNA primase [Gluconacetobacter diazotrophicus]ACI52764.1 DNA primase [Gluconacetobacter diazotrophicus PA1 5]TWB06111.1 DNA primase [Gluconacetobacter diazotrophicus]CAP57279.1 DNA primase [Gluconacetobacter diazotrophicus PA1 5]
MALDPAFLEELRARTPIASVIGRRTKLVRSGRNWKACCPFHGEKTPSFYVYDDHFHCFGCGAHGDVISFVMQSEGRSFPEAVAELAGEAGLEVPRASPREREAEQRARGLSDVLDLVQAAWVRRLHAPEGRAGLAYLRGRGLSDETIAGFGLGWSGDGRGGLLNELAPHGVTPEMLAQAGLMRVDEDGRPKGELFFNRVTFPIRDRRGSLVSFGGRILGDGQPKYLNGPETALFSKRRTLFGMDRARAALRTARPRGAPPVELVVVEGYMDVIALHQAGFPGAVAPLGTALTSEQMEALWQMAAAPILCFDGDGAGQRAAVKAAETALPLLDINRTLRFCALPEGEDPDSLLRGQGSGAVAALLEGARPIGHVLFDLLTQGVRDPGPEQRAAVRRRLVEAAALIADKGLAAEYRSTLLDRFFETYRRRPGQGKRAGQGGQRGDGRQAGVSWPAGSAPAPFDEAAAAQERMRILTAILLRHPHILPEVEDAYCRLDLPPALARVRAAVMDLAASGDLTDAKALDRRLDEGGLAEERMAVVAARPLPMSLSAPDDLMAVDVVQEWWHFFALLNVRQFGEDIRLDTESLCAGTLDARSWASLRTRLLAWEALRRGDLTPGEG